MAELGEMEDVDVQKLSRKELLQLCTEQNIRTAGVKHDDLIRLLQKKLYPPPSDPPRVTPKARSQIGSDSPVSSPKARNQTSADSPFSSPNATGKPPERASLPTPGSTSQGRSLRPLVLVDHRLRNNSPEPSPRTPRKDQLAPNPAALPRKPTTTKSSAPPAQRSDLLRKKVNTLTAIGKLQAQDRARPAQQSDPSSVRGRNNAVSGPIGKQAQETRPQQGDRGSSIRSRGTAAIGAPKKNIRSSSMPVKRPGDRTLRAKSNEASRKGQSANATAAKSEAAANSPRASEGEASVAAMAGSHSDLGSHSFGSMISESATDAGHYATWEDSDADDARSVSSEPVTRFASQIERVHSPRTSGGSKLGRVAYSSWESAHGGRSSLDSSVESNAPLGKDSDLSVALSDENLISLCSPEDDPAFNLVGDAHGLEIKSFFDSHSGAPEGSQQVEELEAQGRAPESISMAGLQANDVIANFEKSMRGKEAVSEAAPSTTQKDESSDSTNPRVEQDVSARDCRQQDSSIPAIESNAPVGGQEDAATRSGRREQETEANDIPIASSRNGSTLNLVQDKDSSSEGAHSRASARKNTRLVSDRPATYSPSHQESSPYDDSGVQQAGKADPVCCSDKDYTTTSTAECIERVHFNMDGAPLPHPDMERSPMSVNRPDATLTPDSTAGEVVDLCGGKSSSPCNELQQDFDIKLRGGQGGSNFEPKHDYNKDKSRKSNLLQSDRSEKVPLLQDGRENENTPSARRRFPFSILLWCSQLFSAIFGTRSQH